MAPVNPTWVNEMIDGLLSIVDILVPLMVTLGLIAFFWGIVKFIYHADDPKERAVGRSFMIWGIIGLFVMVSIFGIIAIFNSLFLVTQGGTGTAPGINNINPL